MKNIHVEAVKGNQRKIEVNIGKRLDIKIIITALNRKKKRIRENEIQRGENRRERRVEDGSEMCKDDNIH